MGGEGVTIENPIEQRNTGKGNPNAILHFSRPLNQRQEKLLKALPAFDSRTVVNKKDVCMKDLSALTAVTGVEYAMFTRKSKRLIIRGNEVMTNVDVETAIRLAEQGYRWSGHTHPGNGKNVLLPSDGDKLILRQFSQEYSCIWNQRGQYATFEKEG